MQAMTIRIGVPALAALLAAGLAAGCDAGGKRGAADKAGGPSAPTVLRLADSDAVEQPDTPAIKYFAAQVAKLSRGAVRIRITFAAAGDKVPDVEPRTARLVREGKFDLGWIGARAWDELGVKSFQALQAPLLITDYTLLDKVATSRLTDEMLAGLKSQGVVGLALVPDLLRHPVGLKGPLVSLADFARARVRVQPSRASDALMTAFGAAPVEVSNSEIGAAIAHGRIDGEELSLGNAPGGSTVTANITFFGKTLTLFAARRSYERLTDEQRQILRTAAERTLRHVVANPPSESALARRFCVDGRIVLASKSELVQLVRASQPVYSQLERDPHTKALVASIRTMKTTTPHDPPFVVPKGCGRHDQVPSARGNPRPPGIVNGTYHLLFTVAAARAFGPPATDPANAHYPGVDTRILNDGKWQCCGGHGTYTIRGNTLTFVGGGGPVHSFTFTLDRNGTLRLKPVLPMDPGDQWVIAGVPWRRVGPPIKKLP
jgi:TRAP-type C4-dicarboxylate transport system substrate-binding protein